MQAFCSAIILLVLAGNFIALFWKRLRLTEPRSVFE